MKAAAKVLPAPAAAPLAPAPAGGVPVAALAATLRGLGGAFEHVGDFRNFFAALSRTLGASGLLTDATIQLGRESPAEQEAVFAPGLLTVPLVGRGEVHGALQIARRDRERRFGAEDLQLLSALGACVAALADHALAHREALRRLDELRFLLDQAPVGFVLFDGETRPILVNATARRWLGEAAAGDPVKLLSTPAAPGAAARQYVRLAGKLVSAETLAAPGGDSAGGARVVVLTDLTPEQTSLLESLGRELFRAHWKQRPLCFALLEDRRGQSALLAALPDLRANLGVRDVCGPYDAHRIGLVFPEQSAAAVMRRLRRLRPLFAVEHTVAALVAAGEGDAEAETLLQRTLGAMQPLADLLRPAVLLHDDYPAVNDSLALALRRDFAVAKSSSLAETRALLGSRPFDAIVTELDLQEGTSGLALAHEARLQQPELRAVFTAAAGRARRIEDDALLRTAAFFGKPFAVEEVAAHLRATLAPAR